MEIKEALEETVGSKQRKVMDLLEDIRKHEFSDDVYWIRTWVTKILYNILSDPEKDNEKKTELLNYLLLKGIGLEFFTDEQLLDTLWFLESDKIMNLENCIEG